MKVNHVTIHRLGCFGFCFCFFKESLICLGKSFSPLTGKNISCPDNKQNKIKQRASRDFLKLKEEKKPY